MKNDEVSEINTIEMDFKDIKQAYFLGIGGIGMSAIARYFHSMGIKVMGYDKTETSLTKELVAEGIQIHYEDFGSRISDFGLMVSDCLVVLTPAIPKDHGEWAWLREQGHTIMKRSQVLGVITDAYKTIGVAGTHGKTTTSTLIAHILKSSMVDCAAFLGGIASNYNTNLLLHRPTDHTTQLTEKEEDFRPWTDQQFMVVESDEFDRSFLTLHPSISIITSTDADHLDIYGEHDELKKTFMDYASQTRDGGTLFLKKGLDINPDVKKNFLTYSNKEEADVYSSNIRITGDEYSFDLNFVGKEIKNLKLGIPGLHNVENATAASAACLTAGVTEDELREALASFKGVKRRFEYIIKRPDFVYIDDYAHHPEELRAIISSVKQMYQGKKIAAIFQPHLYTRTRDFVDGFAESLSLLDDVLLLDIYPARELPIEGITSEIILSRMSSINKRICKKDEVIDMLKKIQPDVFLTLGAGDIDQLVEPIRVEMSK
jgi:UDP-N-acetylmuramate--alanine ligase